MPRWLVVCETAAVPRRTVLLASGLSRRVQVEVFCWSRRGTSQVPAEIAGLVRLSRGRSFPGFVGELLALLREGFDGVLVADLRVLTVLVAVAPGVRVVYDRMEIPTVSAADRVSRWLPGGFGRALRIAEAWERVVAGRARLILSVPIRGSAWDHVQRLGPPVVSVPNWPSVDELADGRREVGVSLTHPLRILHTGAISEETGLLLVLDALRLLGPESGVRLILVGYLVGVTADGLRREIDDRGLADAVDVVPRVPYERLPRLLNDADVGLGLLDPEDRKFVSARPGMSRKVFTYMAAGLAVISNDETGHWLEERGAGIAVDYGSAEALARALRSLADDPARVRRLGDAGRRTVAEESNWERVRDQVLDRVLTGTDG